MSNRVKTSARIRFAVGFVSVGLACASGAFAQYDLVAGRALPAGATATSFATADVDEDGRVDVIVPGGSGLLIQTLPEPFAETAAPPEWPVSGSVTALVAGDFDADGHADVALAVAIAGSTRLEVLFGDGRGGISARVDAGTFAGTIASHAFETFDANGDALADFAIAREPSGFVSIVSQVGAAGRQFAPPVDAAVAGNGIRLATGDFGGDGRQDVVAAVESDNRLLLLEGDGAGGFTRILSFQTNSSPIGIAAGDFDRDGLTDVVQADWLLHVFLGDPIFGLTRGWSQNSGNSTTTVVTGDVDGDGILDLLTSAFYLGWLKGDGFGAFGQLVFFEGDRNDEEIRLADVTGDGVDDMLALGTVTGSVAVFEGLGPGSFVRPELLSGSTTGHGIASDANADGTVDLVITGAIGGIPPGTGRLFFHFGDGAGGILSRGEAQLRVPPNHVASGELIGGGDADLALVTTSADTVTLLRGGGGGFSGAGDFATASGPVASAVGDFDGDGSNDIATANGGASVATVLFGDGTGAFTSRASPPLSPQKWIESADLDADGRGDLVLSLASPPGLAILFCDPSRTITAVRTAAVGPSPGGLDLGDVDRDGAVDVILGDEADASFRVFFGDGARGIVRLATFPTAAPAIRVSLGDATGDGLQDVLVAHGGARLFSVHAGDGRGDFAPAATFRSPSSATHIFPVDLGEDGSTELVVPSLHASASLYRWRDTPLSDAMRGTVDAGRGPARDVLLVNGASGGFSREIRLRSSDALLIRVARPPAELAPVPLAVYAWTTVPTHGTVRALPLGIGSMALPMPLVPGVPAPREIWNSFGRVARLGAPTRPSAYAPTFLLQLPSGLGRAATFTLQGIILDGGAPNGAAAVTNGIVVRVR